jgi:hypothetical protein
MKAAKANKYTNVINDMIAEVVTLTGKKFKDLDIDIMTKDEVYEALEMIRSTLPASQKTLLNSLDYGDTDLEECQYWTGGHTTDGYGLSTRSPAAEGIVPGATVMNAQRRVMLLAKGLEALLSGDGSGRYRHVDHACHVASKCEYVKRGEKCEHRLCVNLGHLAIMPEGINVLKSKKPECTWGHDISTPDKYRLYGNSRHCICCGVRADQMNRVQKKAERAIQRAETHLLTTAPEDEKAVKKEIAAAKKYYDYIVAYVEDAKARKVWVHPER